MSRIKKLPFVDNIMALYEKSRINVTSSSYILKYQPEKDQSVSYAI